MLLKEKKQAFANDFLLVKCFFMMLFLTLLSLFPPAPDSFCPKKFFTLCGLTKKSPADVKNVFGILDNDGNGFVEEEELK